MFQHKDTTQHTCPTCGGALMADHDLLCCSKHGAFFAYGPHLLVRVPRAATRTDRPLLPWEQRETISVSR